MPRQALNNTRIASQSLLPSPETIIRELPVTDKAEATVRQGRSAIESVLAGKESRRIVISGPCSIHDVDAALDYARRLRKLADEVNDAFIIVMRVYFEKPRTTTGWKGLINDPYMDDSFAIDEGVRIARQLLIDINEIGLPVATEALDPIMPQYLSDLVTWSAIGARTTESQTHREMASGLSMPVGIKNATDGSLDVAINALKAIGQPHAFLGITPQGQCAVTRTTGNRHGHLVLRGGKEPNYDSVHIRQCEQALSEAGLTANIMVDCSHSNSHKNPGEQPLVFENCIEQIINGQENLIGMMLESHLNWGKQRIPDNLEELAYGVSVTDACIDWPTTDKLLQQTAARLRHTRSGN